MSEPPAFTARQPEFLEQCKKLRMFFESDSFDQSRSIKNNSQRPLRGDRRIELFERTRRGIARICEFRQTRFAALRVQFGEAAFVQKRFAAHLQNIRRTTRQAGW